MAAHFDNRDGYIWFNGELVDWPDVKLHVLSHALHYASSVFEGERVYNKKIFKLEEHTERLFYSAERMDMKIPYSKEEINNATKKIVSVHTFICNGTIEDRIDAMIEQKISLAQSVVGEGEGWITELSDSELKDLLTLKDAA